MSASAPPDGALDAARRQLAGRGYLQDGLPHGARARWQGIVAGTVVAAAWASLLAAAAGAGGHAGAAAVGLLALGLLPLAIGAVAFGCGLGSWLARALLRAGGAPQAIATTLAPLAGAAVVASTAGVLADAGRASRIPLLTLLAAVALASVVMALARQGLLRRLEYRLDPRSSWRGVLMFGGLLGAALLLLLLSLGPARKDEIPTAASFPPPRGRVAVLAVDGLAREDLDALAGSDAELRRLAGWGWAPLEIDGRGSLPAVVWTTVACGTPPPRHGVEEIEEVRLFGSRSGVALGVGMRSLVVTLWRPFGMVSVVARPALERRAPTFWEMASRAGCRVWVGGWWGSWPVRRVLGEVASERAWLGGGAGEDAVTPLLAPLVRETWASAGNAATASDRLANALARRAAHEAGSAVAAIAMPSLDLVERSAPHKPPLALAAALAPHAEALGRVIETLQSGGFDVWLAGVPWQGGTPFVACSRAPEGGRLAAIRTLELAGTWLDQLGLPVPQGAPPPRRDLSGVAAGPPSAASYGPPPPPLAAPSEATLEVQREVLRSLGYLQ